jgi:hypothetical protein
VKNRERDESIDRLLRRGVGRDPDAHATASCLDADTVAAWMEGSLTPDEAARAEAHASGCDRCQALLAAVARTLPPSPTHSWWRAQTFRWMAPITAVAAALIVWVAVDRDRAAPRSMTPAEAVPAAASPSPERRAAPPDEAKRSDAKTSDPTTPANASSASRAAQSSAAASPRRTSEPSARGEGASRDDARRMDAMTAPAAKSAQPADRGGGQARERVTASSPPSAPAPPTPPPFAAAPLPRDAQAPRGVSETVSVAEAPTLGQREAAADLAPKVVEIRSPESAFRWRLVDSASVERSTDGGATWTPQSTIPPGASAFAGRQSSPASTVLTAGSAPARDVCWIVGRAGVVFVSSNGTTWERKPFPEPLNLSAIRASDARSAVVTTEDGRQFSTIDGGLTWSKVP